MINIESVNQSWIVDGGWWIVKNKYKKSHPPPMKKKFKIRVLFITTTT